MKRISLILLLLLLMVFQSNAQEQDPCWNYGGFTDPDTGQCIVSSGLSFEIAYPLELLDYPFAMSIIEEFLTSTRTTFLSDFETMGVPSSGPWALSIQYELFQHSDTVQSIRFDIGTYTGGAHGNQTIQTYTFDLANETVLTFEDLFLPDADALSVIAPLAQAALEESQGEMADTDWIATGTAPDLLNYQDFVLTEDSIIFYFEPYMVAPFAAGVQQVEIPLSDLSAILQADILS
jgi:hypothetical protein